MKNKTLLLVKKIYNYKFFPFIILALIMIIYKIFTHTDTNDDIYFSSALSEYNFFSYLKMRYLNWTSRLLIESLLITISRVVFIWKILDVFIMVSIGIILSKLFNPTNNIKTNFIILYFMIFFQYILAGTAGWIATTLNYTWILFFALISFIPIKKVLENKSFRWYEYILYTICTLFASNQEQMVVVIFSTLLIFNIYLIYIKKFNIYIFFQFILNILSFIFILLSPGNGIRKIREITAHFPEFSEISIWRKLEIGFSSTLFKYIFNLNLIFTAFVILLFIAIFIKYRHKLKFLICGSIPLFITLSFGAFKPIISQFFPYINDIPNSLTKTGTNISLSSPITWIPNIILATTFLFIIISLYLLFDNKKIALFTIFIILIGFASRIVMSLSPTIWESSDRTFIFMHFSFIIISIFIYNKIRNIIKNNNTIYIDLLFSLFFILSIIKNIYEIYSYK
ncbi:MAG: hypothetical protein KFW09_06480 [Oscillospiraceae bacterium]|nr:hypothetical protein [Oscillospiraceae bacterium]